MNEKKNFRSVEDRLDIGTIVRDVLKNFWAILLIAVCAALIVNMVLTMNHQRSYQTKTTLVIKSKTTSNYSYTNLTAASRMANSFTNILSSGLLKKKVCEELNMDSFNAKVSANVVTGTNLVTMVVTAESPQEAYLVIRSIMNQITGLTQYVSGDLVMEVLQEPDVPAGADASFSPRSQMKKGFLIGAALGVVLFAVLSFFKDTVKTEKDIEKELQVRNIGVLYHENRFRGLSSLFKKNSGRHLITDLDARFDFVERVKKIGTTISGHARRNHEQVIMITSVGEHEGKSTIAANLALALARQSDSVLLIDGDLRRPTQKKLFLNSDEVIKHDLGSLLNEECSVKDAIRYDKDKNLFMFLTDRNYKNSTDIIAGKRMRNLIQAAKKRFDYIIIDTPPMALMADAEAIADMADMSILVIKQDTTRIPVINEAIDTLTNCSADFYGCILNNVRTLSGVFTQSNYGGYSRYGRYGRYGNYGRYGRYGRYGNYGRYGAYGNYGNNTRNEEG